MKLPGWTTAAIVVSLLALGGMSVADEAPATTAQETTATADASKEAPKTIDERVTDLEKSIGALADFQLSGMFYTSFLWNFNEPDNRINSLRSLDNQEDTFGVDLFQLGIGKKGPGVCRHSSGSTSVIPRAASARTGTGTGSSSA